MYICIEGIFFSFVGHFSFASCSALKGRGFRISLQTDFRALEMEEGSNLHDGAMSSAESAGMGPRSDDSAAASSALSRSLSGVLGLMALV